MANEDQYPSLTETQPTNKSFAVISDFLKKYTEKNAWDKALVGGIQKLAETIAYDEPLTTGRGETLHLKPEALEALNFIPQSKGGSALATIGPVGMRRLAAEGEPLMHQTATRLRQLLEKANPTDWQTQKQMVEATGPNWFAVPRGRDINPDLPHVKFGAEIPETRVKLEQDLIDALLGKQKVTIPLPEVLDSPRHFKAYPQLNDYRVLFDPKMTRGTAFARPSEKLIGMGPMDSPQELGKVLNHELAHAVQRFEGWPTGTSTNTAAGNLLAVDQFRRAGVDAPKEIQRQYDLAKHLRYGAEIAEEDIVPRSIAHMAYRRAAGEQLAEAIARSGEEGGGKVVEHYTHPFDKMYDPAVLEDTIKKATDTFNAELWGLK